MRTLVTSDDGIHSVGVPVLVRELRAFGHDDVVVVCPPIDVSGSGTSVRHASGSRRLAYREVELPGCPNVAAYEVAQTPVGCVIAAFRGGFGPPPTVVVAGINLGLNTGPRVVFSGTVSAAIVAPMYGGKGVAVSVARGEPQHLNPAARLAVRARDWIDGQPVGTVINLNVPNVSQIRGVRRATLAPVGTGRAWLESGRPGELTVRFAPLDCPLPVDCDTQLIARGYATVTPIRAIHGSDGPDPAAYLTQE
jgi:5'-nucleotidase